MKPAERVEWDHLPPPPTAIPAWARDKDFAGTVAIPGQNPGEEVHLVVRGVSHAVGEEGPHRQSHRRTCR